MLAFIEWRCMKVTGWPTGTMAGANIHSIVHKGWQGSFFLLKFNLFQGKNIASNTSWLDFSLVLLSAVLSFCSFNVQQASFIFGLLASSSADCQSNLLKCKSNL